MRLSVAGSPREVVCPTSFMSDGYRLTAASGLHKGDREYQQDQVAIITHPRIAGYVMAVVADGMGGRSGGRKASDQVIMTARQLFERFVITEDSVAELLEQIVEEAHTVIQLTAISAEQEPLSTIAAFVVLPNGRCHWVHVGDSRVHHFHRGTPVFRTTDHSYVQALVEQGKLKPEEAENHPKSNMLLHSLGAKNAPRRDQHVIEQLRAGDAMVACSDGLWHYVSEDEMAILVERLGASEAAQAMVQRARDRANGGGDNISVAIIKVEPLA